MKTILISALTGLFIGNVVLAATPSILTREYWASDAEAGAMNLAESYGEAFIEERNGLRLYANLETGTYSITREGIDNPYTEEIETNGGQMVGFGQDYSLGDIIPGFNDQ